MSKSNIAASVRQRLKNYAKSSNESFNLVLVRFGLERLLYRITISPHASQLILKGGSLFYCWTEHLHRPTRDIDFLSLGEANPERFRKIFEDVIVMEAPEDGLKFDRESLTVETIKDDQKYSGIRVTLIAYLENARINLQADIGFGDAVMPAAVQIDYPVLLDLPVPRIAAYQKETVIAEKFQAMVDLGIANSRMKDFFDLWTFAREFEFDGEVLGDAIGATFERRETAVPKVVPLALTSEFADDPTKQKQWAAFANKLGLKVELPELTKSIKSFLMPCAEKVAGGSSFRFRWAKRKWQPKS